MKMNSKLIHGFYDGLLKNSFIKDNIRDGIVEGGKKLIDEKLTPLMTETVPDALTKALTPLAAGAVGAMTLAQPLMSKIFPTQVQTAGGGKSSGQSGSSRKGIRSPNYAMGFKNAPTQ